MTNTDLLLLTRTVVAMDRERHQLRAGAPPESLPQPLAIPDAITPYERTRAHQVLQNLNIATGRPLT